MTRWPSLWSEATMVYSLIPPRTDARWDARPLRLDRTLTHVLVASLAQPLPLAFYSTPPRPTHSTSPRPPPHHHTTATPTSHDSTTAPHYSTMPPSHRWTRLPQPHVTINLDHNLTPVCVNHTLRGPFHPDFPASSPYIISPLSSSPQVVSDFTPAQYAFYL